MAGEQQFSELRPEERMAAHALIDARIAERAARQGFGAAARTTGQTTMSLDDDGNLIEVSPDGSRRQL